MKHTLPCFFHTNQTALLLTNAPDELRQDHWPLMAVFNMVQNLVGLPLFLGLYRRL